MGRVSDWVSLADLPASLARVQGVAKYVLSIDATGGVAACEIPDSSGNEELDRIACSALMSRARFTPAIDSTGQPVASVYAGTITFGGKGY